MSQVEYIPDEDAKDDTTKAPITLMADFLKTVEEEETEVALKLAEQILSIEPNNGMIKDYILSLREVKKEEDAEEKMAEEGKESSSDEEDINDEGKETDSHSEDGEDKEDGVNNVNTQDDKEQEPQQEKQGLSMQEHLDRFQAMYESAERERQAGQAAEPKSENIPGVTETEKK
mmetsp:Transcript_5610/g.6970  ORF Transcript_5610/g.6970 Transcript_5610/m.6970 type:complete len:174 (+) Transcript_5610:37-558(+)